MLVSSKCFHSNICTWSTWLVPGERQIAEDMKKRPLELFPTDYV